jgi:hypothetical protein
MAERGSQLRAHTVVYDDLIPDEERRYASMVGDALGIPIDFFVADPYEPFASPAALARELPEPAEMRFRGMWLDICATLARRTRVVLLGIDGDSLFNDMTTAHFAHLVRTRRFVPLAASMVRYAWWLQRCPPIALRTTLRKWIGRERSMRPPFPAWLQPDFVSRCDLAGRWRDVWADDARRQRSLRPRAMATVPHWPRAFEAFDAATSSQPIEFRSPLADYRLVNYALSIPAVPWCTAKTLLREAGRHVLPEPVRRRRKAPLAGDPLIARLRQPGHAWLDMFQPTAALERYVDRRAIPAVTGANADGRVYVNLRPIMLNWWLEHAWNARKSWRREAHDRGTRQVRDGAAGRFDRVGAR